MNSSIKVGIAEDHRLVREGLVKLLGEHDGIQVSLEATDGMDLLEKLLKTRPHIILLDIEMPRMAGKETLERIRANYPAIKVIIVSAFFQEQFIVEFIRMGASAFLAKDCSIDKVVDTIHGVYKHGTYFDNNVSDILARQIRNTPSFPISPESFTEQELQIIRLICDQKTSTQIADQLSLSKRTVDWHRSKILRKANVPSVNSLIVFARNNGLLGEG